MDGLKACQGSASRLLVLLTIETSSPKSVPDLQCLLSKCMNQEIAHQCGDCVVKQRPELKKQKTKKTWESDLLDFTSDRELGQQDTNNIQSYICDCFASSWPS